MNPTETHPFDLQARAAAAARGLTALLDQERDGLMYFLGEWRARPPIAYHGLWDYGDGSGRHLDALTLLRTMLPPGEATNPDRGEDQLEAWTLRLLEDDGLSWIPDEPWATPWGKDVLLANPSAGGRLAEISWAQRGALLGLTTRFLRTPDERYLVPARKLVDGLLHAAVRNGHGLIYPEGYYRKSGWGYDRPGFHPGIEEYNAAVAVPALRFYEAAGYEPALELADGLLRAALYYTPCYLPDGRLRPTVGELENHFHTHSNFVLAVLQLGITLNRREYISWARQSYEHLTTWGTDFGWFPEGVGQRHGELCCTTDMIELALLLGRHMDRRYFSDAERYGRNHLLESQFLSLDLLQEALDRLPDPDKPPSVSPYSTSHGVTETQLGAFASRSILNDAFHLDATALMQCCNAAGARALYDLWHYAVEEQQSDAAQNGIPHYRVDLRFSVRTPVLTIVSHEPTTGRLDVTPANACHLSVRLPKGAHEAIALVRSAGHDHLHVRNLTADLGYVDLDLPAQHTVELHYALPERSAHYEVGHRPNTATCTAHWLGETIVTVDPPGPYYPLYNRSTDLQPVVPVLPALTPIPSL